MVVLRDESCVTAETGNVPADTANITDSFEVELMKKPGKGLGLSIVGKKSGPGIFISDIVSAVPSLVHVHHIISTPILPQQNDFIF